MAKAPRAGTVKTRLCPPLTPGSAAALATAFLRDTVRNAQSVGCAVTIAYAPEDAESEMRALLPADDLCWTPQRGDDLGARMNFALVAAASSGSSPLIVIGTDSPTLPVVRLRQAVDLLAQDAADVVLGPSDDGGYYLVGMRRPIPGLFQDVAWSTEATRAQTLRNADRLGLRAEALSPWYDIDTPADLERIRAELRHEETISSGPPHIHSAPHTRNWLHSHENLDSHPYD